jgi:2-methylfumaryl-CoA isomerase
MSPASDDATRHAPLEGLRVVEAGTFVAVPSGGMSLAMLGADVIRIDPPGGGSDQHRAPLGPDGTSIYWASLNKGKRSIVIDLRSEEGRELAIAIATADGPDGGVFLTNAVGGGWGDEATLRSRRPDMITAQLNGNRDGSSAVDYTVNHEVGFASVTGAEPSGGPTMHVLPAWDLLAGLHLATAILAAERRRSRTGQGDRIVLSLADVALWATDALGYLAEVQTTGRGRERTGRFVYGTFGSPFPTADGGEVMIVALTPRQWSDLVELTGAVATVAELAERTGEDFRDEHARYRHREALHALIAPWFAARPTDAAMAAIAGTRLLAGRLGTFESVARGPLVVGNPMFRPVVHPRLGDLLASGGPAFFAAAGERPEPLAPTLGADTESVLADVLSLSGPEIGRLHDAGIVGGGR